MQMFSGSRKVEPVTPMAPTPPPSPTRQESTPNGAADLPRAGGILSSGVSIKARSNFRKSCISTVRSKARSIPTDGLPSASTRRSKARSERNPSSWTARSRATSRPGSVANCGLAARCTAISNRRVWSWMRPPPLSAAPRSRRPRPLRPRVSGPGRLLHRIQRLRGASPYHEISGDIGRARLCRAVAFASSLPSDARR